MGSSFLDWNNNSLYKELYGKSYGVLQSKRPIKSLVKSTGVFSTMNLRGKFWGTVETVLEKQITFPPTRQDVSINVQFAWFNVIILGYVFVLYYLTTLFYLNVRVVLFCYD